MGPAGVAADTRAIAFKVAFFCSRVNQEHAYVRQHLGLPRVVPLVLSSIPLDDA